MVRRDWTRDELLVAFNLYCRTPFGQIHTGNPTIVDFALRIGRTAGALAMKLANFASFDTALQKRGVRGLRGASRADRAIWDEFHGNWGALACESELALQRLHVQDSDIETLRFDLPTGPTEVTRAVRTRLVQSFFRHAVLASYDYRCTLCSLAVPDLLIASHIIPWRIDQNRRADPRNGLALCVLHDRAFDTGLISIDDRLRVLVSAELNVPRPPQIHVIAFLEAAGSKIRMPQRFAPDPMALEYHRTRVFRG